MYNFNSSIFTLHIFKLTDESSSKAIQFCIFDSSSHQLTWMCQFSAGLLYNYAP